MKKIHLGFTALAVVLGISSAFTTKPSGKYFTSCVAKYGSIANIPASCKTTFTGTECCTTVLNGQSVTYRTQLN
jgi:uncharacterized protein YmfQ (DUF2313 family)